MGFQTRLRALWLLVTLAVKIMAGDNGRLLDLSRRPSPERNGGTLPEQVYGEELWRPGSAWRDVWLEKKVVNLFRLSGWSEVAATIADFDAFCSASPMM